MVTCNIDQKTCVWSEFTFIPETGAPWIIKITKDGIRLNREEYPNVSPDGFSNAFCEILERNYDVTFTKKV